jgi:uncharacterized coiled-coil protein SlyX
MATQQEDALAAANSRLTALQDQVAKQATDLESAKAEAAGAKGDADKARLALEDVTRQLEQLKQANQALSGQVAQSGLPPIPDLPKGAFQVTQAVTTHSGPATKGPDGKERLRRIDVRAGEVVYVDGTEKQVTALQQKLGQAVRVFAVDAGCETDLRSMNALR